MKRLLTDQVEQVAQWVVERIPGMTLGDSPYWAMGLLDRRGYLVAGTVYSNFTERDVHIHHAQLTQRSMSARYLGETFRYPFYQLKVRRCTVIVSAANAASLKFVRHLGFVQEGRIRSFFETGDDAFIFGMLREECRWLSLGIKHGKPSEPEPAGRDVAAALHGRPDAPPDAPGRRSRTAADGRSGSSTLPLGGAAPHGRDAAAASGRR